MQYPAGASAEAGVYDFEISVAKSQDNSREIRFKLLKNDNSYGFAGFAVDDGLLKDIQYFNSVMFALDSGNTTTALHLRDVHFDRGDPVALPQWVTSGEVNQPGTPAFFALSQNYPNPFNPETKISYQLKVTSKVVLKIFDVTGSEIKTFVNQNQQAGKHSITFNASGLASGIYYYILVAGDYIETRKMVLLK